MRSSDIHLRAILQKISQSPISKIDLKITYLKCHSNLPGANELNHKNKINLSTDFSSTVVSQQSSPRKVNNTKSNICEENWPLKKLFDSPPLEMCAI